MIRVHCRMPRHAGVTNVEDLRQLAKKTRREAIFDYVDRGSYDEATLRANPRRPRGSDAAPARGDRRRRPLAGTTLVAMT